MDTLRNTGDSDLLIWKVPDEQILPDTVLYVAYDEEAILIKDGKIICTYDNGTHSLPQAMADFLSQPVDAQRDLPPNGIYFMRLVLPRTFRFPTEIPVEILAGNNSHCFRIPASIHYSVMTEHPSAFLARMLRDHVDICSRESCEAYLDYIHRGIRWSMEEALLHSPISVSHPIDLEYRIVHELRDRFFRELCDLGFYLEDLRISDLNIPDKLFQLLKDETSAHPSEMHFAPARTDRKSEYEDIISEPQNPVDVSDTKQPTAKDWWVQAASGKPDPAVSSGNSRVSPEFASSDPRVSSSERPAGAYAPSAPPPVSCPRKGGSILGRGISAVGSVIGLGAAAVGTVVGGLASAFPKKVREGTSVAFNGTPSQTGSETVQPPEIQHIGISAVAPRKFVKGEYSVISVMLYEEKYRHMVDALVTGESQEFATTTKVTQNAMIRIQLSSPDLAIESDVQEAKWCGKFLQFAFGICLPESYAKRSILFHAHVYIDGVLASCLTFSAKCSSFLAQRLQITRNDIMSAFVSYASEDRDAVISLVQGMQKVRRDLKVFLDVEKLRSGEDWQERLYGEIDNSDVLFLCWSRSAKESPWVDKEWRYAFAQKGSEGIDPIPLEPAEICPPPAELSQKHFNDILNYMKKNRSW